MKASPSSKISIKGSLSDHFPELATQWHPTKNTHFLPGQFTPGSNERAWWKCSKGEDHEWQESIVARTKIGNGCPYCSRHRASKNANLLVEYPAIAAEWHTHKNELRPDQVLPGSGKKVWWLCSKDANHEWEQKIVNRCSRGQGCIYCSGSVPSSERNLAFCEPAIAALWHKEKNSRLSPAQVLPASEKEVWWQCSDDPDHAYKAKICNRVRSRSGCPLCNTLEVRFPELLCEWDFEENSKLKLEPSKISMFSNKRVSWRCKKFAKHQWTSSLEERTLRGSGCPFCSRHRASEEQNFALEFPGLAQEWHPVKNCNLTPRDVLPSSMKSVWWQCSKNSEHEWESTLHQRTRRHGQLCPFCSSMELSNLASIYPELVAELDTAGNGKLDPKKVKADAKRKFIWKCTNQHRWKTTISERARYAHCPFCTGERSLDEIYSPEAPFNKHIPFRPESLSDNSLQDHFPEISKEWHFGRNLLLPSEVHKSSGMKVFWKCEAAGHEWTANIQSRARNGAGCPYCTGKKTTPERALSATHPQLVEEWNWELNKQLGLTPENVSKGNGNCVWWTCQKGHVFDAIIGNRTRNGHGCPYCSGQRASKENCLSTRYPLTASLWHPTKNELSSEDVLPGSKKLVWWRCHDGHEFQRRIAKMVLAREHRLLSGCTVCTAMEKRTRTLRGHRKSDQRTQQKELTIMLDEETQKLNIAIANALVLQPV